MVTSVLYGALDPATQAAVDGFVHAGNYSASTVAAFLRRFPAGDRASVAASLVAAGVPATSASVALDNAGRLDGFSLGFWEVLQLASVAASAYHGARRNRGSFGWALGWGVLGAIFPIVTPIVAIAQGYAKPKR